MANGRGRWPWEVLEVGKENLSQRECLLSVNPAGARWTLRSSRDGLTGGVHCNAPRSRTPCPSKKRNNQALKPLYLWRKVFHLWFPLWRIRAPWGRAPRTQVCSLKDTPRIPRYPRLPRPSSSRHPCGGGQQWAECTPHPRTSGSRFPHGYLPHGTHGGWRELFCGHCPQLPPGCVRQYTS